MRNLSRFPYKLTPHHQSCCDWQEWTISQGEKISPWKTTTYWIAYSKRTAWKSSQVYRWSIHNSLHQRDFNPLILWPELEGNKREGSHPMLRVPTLKGSGTRREAFRPQLNNEYRSILHRKPFSLCSSLCLALLIHLWQFRVQRCQA